MTAYRITSMEDERNRPCIFLFVNGAYYGCNIYPSLRHYPTDINYWLGATSSDADRTFIVEEVRLSRATLAIIKKKTRTHDEVCAMRKQEPYFGWPLTEEERKLQLELYNYNSPIDTVSYRISEEIRDILLKLKTLSCLI